MAWIRSGSIPAQARDGGAPAARDTSQRVVDLPLDRFGRIDSLVNNAGMYVSRPFTEYTLEDYLAITR